MASGRLQGDEYKSVVENAPILAQSIENYMRNVRGVKGAMKDWSSEGLLTADIIKAAMFASADEIEERWANMPRTWGQNWIRMQNIGLYALTPLLEKINALANDPRVLVAMDAMGAALNALAGVGIWTIDVFAAGAEWIADNWSVIGPVVFGLAVAFGVLRAATLAYAVAQGVANLALLKSPLTWVALAIGVLTVVFYKLVAAVNKFAGTSYSATGLIMGYFFTLGAFVHNNFFLPLWNAVADIVNFFANAWKDPMGAVKIMFMQLALDAIGHVRNMARALESLLNAIPGVKVSMTSALDGIYNDISDSIANQKAGMGWEDVIKRREQIDYTAAFAGGYDFGKGIVDKFSDMSGFEFPESGAGDWSDIAANTALIAANTSKQADFGEEELKLWRDIAERDAINRFTTAEVSVAFGDVNNNVSSDMDLDGIAEYIGNSIEETLEIVAMGVYE
jgi:tape measure domain-containing protein